MEDDDEILHVGDITAEELDGLSIEERAAIEEDFHIEALRKIVAGPGDDAGERDNVGDRDEPFIPTYSAKLPEDYEQQLAALEQRRGDAIARLKAGDIELDAMLAEQNAVDEGRRELEAQKLKAEIAADQTDQAHTQHWMLQVRRFMRGVQKDEGIDYQHNLTLNAALDAEVKALANDGANKGWTGRQFLEEAHKRVKQTFRLKAEAHDRQGEGDEDRHAGGVHGDRDAQDDAGFEDLDGLSGMEIEAAVAKMTPEQQERWSRSS